MVVVGSFKVHARKRSAICMSISQHVQPTKDSVRASRVYGVGFKDTGLNIHSFKQNLLTIVVHVYH